MQGTANESGPQYVAQGALLSASNPCIAVGFQPLVPHAAHPSPPSRLLAAWERWTGGNGFHQQERFYKRGEKADQMLG